jgi:hypothetical protein
MAEKYSLVGKTLILKIADVFGTVDATIVQMLGTAQAKIHFKSYGSSYEMVVPVEWLFTKNTANEQNAYVTLEKGAEVKANIQLDEITTRKVKVLGEGEGYLVVQAGSRVRVLPISSLKEAVVREEETLPAPLPTTAPATRARTVVKTAVAPVAVAPVRVSRTAPTAAVAPVPAARARR